MRPAAALTDAGVATWNIEYRRLGNEGGGWPGTFQDVAHAADFVRTLPREHSGSDARHRDRSLGRRASRALARGPAAAGEDQRPLRRDPLRLTGVVSLDGPAD